MPFTKNYGLVPFNRKNYGIVFFFFFGSALILI
jgi:hypothetical protein